MEPAEVKDRILENISLSVKKVGGQGPGWGWGGPGDTPLSSDWVCGWGPPVPGVGDSPGDPPCKGCGAGDSPEIPSPRGLGLATALGPPMHGLWGWGQSWGPLSKVCGSGDSPRDSHTLGCPWGCLCLRCGAGGHSWGPPESHHHQRCGAEGQFPGQGAGNPPELLGNRGTGVWGQGHPDTHLAGDTFKGSSE